MTGRADIGVDAAGANVAGNAGGGNVGGGLCGCFRIAGRFFMMVAPDGPAQPLRVRSGSPVASL